ncbi:TRAM domain-containing protein (plasmid) [Haloplanus rubicundus]|uniref:TRAM domain-containing protein n=1 Tax=Haloplanus rubicundus TaxID=1547898 RepID=A0A345E815_9EURY|nr:TRAM domain-containing protein [Haloplanus rubicundus]AXG08337.1 TRAM domain-containing protein [Haloplanus rubicundus]
MEISEELECLFSASIEQQNGSYVIDVPERELQLGDLQQGETYRVALVSSTTQSESEQSDQAETEPEQEREPPEPPVEDGETREVEIEDIGEQGDGITRVERGFVVIVPDTKESERVKIEITDVRQNVAFAEVVERLSYYE